MVANTKTKSRKFTPNPEAAKARMNDALQKLEQGIQSLLDSQNYLNYLKFHSSFYHYSWNNTLLIYMQCPTAMHIAGFHDWLKKGRYVRKGEKGIMILAPCPYKKTQKNDNGEEVEINRVGFKTVSVFDVSQTEGEEIPEIVHAIKGDDEGLFEKLRLFAEHLKVPVNVKPIKCNGYCLYQDNKPVEIAINTGLSALHMAKTLMHELSHAVLHTPEEYRLHDVRSLQELEAESTAFIICHHFGLDSSEYSFGYLVNWQGENAVKALRESTNRITKCANQIIEWIESN